MQACLCVVAQYVALRHPTEAKVLVLEQQSLKDSSTAWSLAGGTLDEGETLDEAVRREVREEAGLEVEALVLFSADTAHSAKNDMTKLSLFYLGTASSDAVTISDEHLRYRWCSAAELEELTFQKPKAKAACLAALA